MNLKKIFKSPEFMVGVSITGMLTSTILAVKVTPKVYSVIETEKEKRRLECESDLTKFEILKMSWKSYIPAAGLFTLSAAGLIFANSQQVAKATMFATAYNASEQAFKNYRHKVSNVIGDEEEKRIRHDYHQDIAQRNIPPNNIIVTENECLCLDAVSGRYFKSNVNMLNNAENKLNNELLHNVYCSLNDFYDMIGMSPTKLGEEVGWNSSNGMVSLFLSATITNDQACIVVDFDVSPEYDFKNLH